MIIVRSTSCPVKDGMMRFPKKLNLDKIYVGDLDIAHVRIFPGKKKYKVEVVYKVEALPKRKKGNIAGIDLGLDNLATVAINKRGIRPLLINGRPLKSMNLYFNNKRDKVQSELKKCNDRYMSSKLETLYRKRNNRFNTYMHKASKEIINYCLTHDIGTLVIGYNQSFQNKANLGRKNNQIFTHLPFGKIREKLEYLCKRYNINYILQEESYTSKASFFDNDDLPIYNMDNPQTYEFSGKRIKRGLYQTKDNYLFNADCNGALNILRKSKAVDLTVLCCRGELDTPKRIRIS